MDASAQAAAPEVQYSVEVDTYRVRRPLGALFWLAMLVLPLALAGVVGYTHGSSIEDSLQADGQAALSKAGVHGVTLVMHGRSVTAEVPTGRDPDEVEKVLSAVPGIMSVETKNVYASAREARACQDIQRKIDRATHHQRIAFSGDSTRLTADGSRMVAEVGKLLTACGAVNITVGGHTDSSTVKGGDISLERARVIMTDLKKAGVKVTRMEIRGYGDQFPVAPEDTKAGRVLNQRGSIVVQEED
jgi:outer membrane protein OmpA-like peptidoglycan-associated protein